MAGSLLYKVEGVVQRMHILSVAWAPRVLPLAVIGERLDFRKIAAVAVNIYGNRFPESTIRFCLGDRMEISHSEASFLGKFTSPWSRMCEVISAA